MLLPRFSKQPVKFNGIFTSEPLLYFEKLRVSAGANKDSNISSNSKFKNQYKIIRSHKSNTRYLAFSCQQKGELQDSPNKLNSAHEDNAIPCLHLKKTNRIGNDHLILIADPCSVLCERSKQQGGA